MGTRLSLKIAVLLNILVVFTCVLAVSQVAFPTAVSQAQESNGRPQGGPSPPPPASPSLAALAPTRIGKLRRMFNFLKCEAAKKTKEQELSSTGPQFPRDYDDSDFSIVALVQGKWEVDVEYELEATSVASITFTVFGGKSFSQELLPRGPTGGVAKAAFSLPDWLGEKPQAALITFKAFTDGPNGRVPADFQLNAIGIGDRFTDLQPTSTSRPEFQPAEAGAYFAKVSSREGPQFRGFSSRPSGPPVNPYLPGAVSIYKVYVNPDGLSPVGEFAYWFDSSDKFSRWSADYYRKTKEFRNGRNVSKTLHVAFEKYNELVVAGRNPGAPRSKKWRIPRSAKFPPGEYKIQVTAFLRADGGPDGGKSATRFSQPVKIK